jgi:hypothetical protein
MGLSAAGSIHLVCVQSSPPKAFFLRDAGLAKNGQCRLRPGMVAQTELAVAAPRPAPIAKAGFSTRDRLHAWPCETRFLEALANEHNPRVIRCKHRTAQPRAPAPPPFANPAPSEGFGLLHIRRLPPAITPIRFCSPWPADVVKSVVGAAGLAPIADAGGRGTRIRFCGKSRPDYAL